MKNMNMKTKRNNSRCATGILSFAEKVVELVLWREEDHRYKEAATSSIDCPRGKYTVHGTWYEPESYKHIKHRLRDRPSPANASAQCPMGPSCTVSMSAHTGAQSWNQ
jgi:hypothetical protein